MLEAKANGGLVKAGPKSPDVAQCPPCGGEVRKRRRKLGKGRYTWFYKHHNGIGSGCALRYLPTS
jgi:hypothetical protein